MKEMQQGGIFVILKDEVSEHFAVLDDELVWHGGMTFWVRKMHGII